MPGVPGRGFGEVRGCGVRGRTTYLRRRPRPRRYELLFEAEDENGEDDLVEFRAHHAQLLIFV
jgi:hypothetical protein